MVLCLSNMKKLHYLTAHFCPFSKMRKEKTILIIITEGHLVIFQVARECHGLTKNRLVS